MKNTKYFWESTPKQTKHSYTDTQHSTLRIQTSAYVFSFERQLRKGRSPFPRWYYGIAKLE